METIRSFIALELPDNVKETVALIIKRLRPAQHRYVKWVSPEGTHMTIKFLGNIYSSQISQITTIMKTAAGKVPPLDLRLGGLGMFPNEQRPRVIWVALEGNTEPLATMQREIEKALEPLGFAPENRAFTPHLTLGRVRDNASSDDRKEIAVVVKEKKIDYEASFTLREISLMKSTLTPTGAIYNRLDSAPFIA
ncbi:MAG: RNA 2',3'-cyclic phosphodiesterase [Dehalococcoidia bacterium]|jgi:2'-5' RNA ligase